MRQAQRPVNSHVLTAPPAPDGPLTPPHHPSHTYFLRVYARTDTLTRAARAGRGVGERTVHGCASRLGLSSTVIMLLSIVMGAARGWEVRGPTLYPCAGWPVFLAARLLVPRISRDPPTPRHCLPRVMCKLAERRFQLRRPILSRAADSPFSTWPVMIKRGMERAVRKLQTSGDML